MKPKKLILEQDRRVLQSGRYYPVKPRSSTKLEKIFAVSVLALIALLLLLALSAPIVPAVL